MFKKLLQVFCRYRFWLIFIFLLNMVFGMMLWLLDAEAFIYLFPAMLFGSLLLYGAMGFILSVVDMRKERETAIYFENPEAADWESIERLFSECDRKQIQDLGRLLKEKEDKIRELGCAMQEYEEYVEAWAHEIKTPMALMTFVLDNRKDEMSSAVHTRLSFAGMKLQEDMERMLYYARLKTAGIDYFFRPLSLEGICRETVLEYQILLQEKDILVTMEIGDFQVISDEKGLKFLISQVISNSVKYQNTKAESVIRFCAAYDESNQEIRLSVRDNGIGVKAYDLPFIFEKGFTGEIGEIRKNSTGMGLYLAMQVANQLKINIDISESCQEGFEIIFCFPVIVT